MKYCPNPKCSFLIQMKQPAEYRDEVKVCVDCGAELVNQNVLLEKQNKSKQNKPKRAGNDAVVTLAVYNSVLEADVGRSKLEQAGIPSFVADEHMGSLNFPATIGGIRLQVLKSDYQSALALLGLSK